MNQFPVVFLIVGASVSLWLIGKKPSFSMLQYQTRSQSTSRSKSELVRKDFQESSNSSSLNYSSKSDLPFTMSLKERIDCLDSIKKLLQKGPDSRLKALKLAHKLPRDSKLRIFKQGLKDSDSRVVIQAAKAISPLKVNYLAQPIHHSIDLPLNISLMR